MKRTIRLLFLDKAISALILPKQALGGLVLYETVTEAALGNPDSYAAPEVICEKIRRLTEARAVDLVIIGNNRGAGLQKAKAVDPAMRNSTMVVWNDMWQGRDNAYLELGFRHFATRKDLVQTLLILSGLRN